MRGASREARYSSHHRRSSTTTFSDREQLGLYWLAILELLYQRLRRRIDAGIDRLISGPYWKLKALFAVLATALFRAFPSYDALQTPFSEATWRDVQVKFDHPLIDTSRIFPAGSHASNLTFRLTVPILAHIFNLDRTGLLIFFALVGFVLLYLVLKVAFTLSGSKRVALFVCLATACTWPGAAAFHELRGGYYDALALCLLVAACATSSSLLAAAFLFLAAWTDERALIASSFVFLLYASSLSSSNDAGGFRRFLVGKPAAVVVAIAAYLGTRAYLTATHSYAHAASGIGLSILSQQTTVIPLAIWTGLGGSWILVLLGMLALFLQRRYLAAAAFCASLAGAIAASMAVVDVTRSMAYCLPAVFVAMAALSRSEGIKQIEKRAAISALISLLVPTYYLEGTGGLWWLYPLPIQIARWLLPAGILHPF
jgi:hypothetical protein